MDARFEDQFHLGRDYYLRHLDFLNWYRYFFLVRAVLDARVREVLEVGGGSGILKACLGSIVERYVVLDVNAALGPDIVADIREPVDGLRGRFDCVIAADVLEHVGFDDVPRSVGHLHSYLRPGGVGLVTIPHRRSHFLFMTPTQVPHVLTVPTGYLSLGAFYRRFIARRIWIDPNHRWEIGDGTVQRRHVEAIFREAGFQVERLQKLLYVDFWILRRAERQ